MAETVEIGNTGSPASTPLTGTETLTLRQGTASVDCTTQDIADLAAASSIPDDSVTNAKLANMASGTFKGRATAGSGDPEDLTAAQARALLPPAVQSVTSAATVTPTFADDMVKVTAQAAALALANPTGTAVPGAGLVIRIKDNGTARAITYGSQYRAIGVSLPATTVISKTLYLGLIYNSDDTKWDVVAVAQEA